MTGRFSIAGKLKVFATREARDEWVDVDTSNPYLGFREAGPTKRKARELWAGLSVSEFNEYIRQEAILLEDDCNEIPEVEYMGKLWDRVEVE